ncbi:MAG: cytochrome P450, partial [Myxococcota bacterium]
QALDGGGPFDLVQDLAIPLPVSLISELLGIEIDRRNDFKHWSDTIIAVTTGPARNAPFGPEVIDAFLDLSVYLSRVIRERKKNPGDDLMSAIVKGQPGETALSVQEAVNFVTLLLVAGNETTTNLIGNAVDALLDHPDQLQLAAKDPSLVPGIIEEALRYDPPIQLLFREAVRETEIAGTRIPKGTIVAPLLASANRDERRFEDPDRFDITRNPQGHLGFGFGAHFCLGTSLARLEARAALEALVPRLGKLERIEPTQRIDSFLIRGPRKLALRLVA